MKPHRSYEVSRILLMVMLVEIAYFTFSFAFSRYYIPTLWQLFVAIIPIIAAASLLCIYYALLNPGTSRLAAKLARRMSAITFMTSAGTFSVMALHHF